MNRFAIALTTLAIVTLAAAGVSAAGKPAPKAVDYPKGYRDWAHVKSMVLQQGHPLFDAFGGIHHVYANDKALKALKEKSANYPDGSVFVFDLLEATVADGAITEGSRKVVGVMQKNAKAFTATGGWGFEGFKGDTKDRIPKEMSEGCFGCHQTQAAKSGFVFTQWRD